ncbi:MAG: putative rane protein [Herbinix sp.]|jgi:hypothetical protein|nr:putative rane protein [Herbinix sp.]
MVSRRIYLTIFILMLMVFVMFMFAGVSSNILSDTATNNRATERVDISHEDTLTADSLNIATGNPGYIGIGRDVFDPEQKLRVAILTSGSEDKIAYILIEWCVYNKYLYKVFTDLPEEEEIADYDVILFGDYQINDQDSEFLYTYANLGKTMMFTQLPDYQKIKSSKELANFFGIKSAVQENITTDGIKIFPNFMINKVREYNIGDYYGDKDDTAVSVPYYSLTAGYEVYSIGILNQQDKLGIENKDLPPLLWRTRTENSFVFVINSDIFKGMSVLGILTGFMAHEREVYVYPVVNAQTISLLSYPYLSNENNTTTQELYSRTSETVARDLLWPNIIQILKNYGDSFSFFAAPQLDYLDDIGPKKDYIDFYLREIGKLPGDMGLSLEQVSKTDLTDLISKDEMFFGKYLPKYNFTALYTADFSRDEVEDSLDNEFLKEVSLVMSDYKEGDNLISFLNENVLSVKFNLDGYQHETMDDLRMICIENAIGMSNTMVDIGRVIYPKDSTDEWNYLSLLWSKGDTYYKDYTKFDMVSIYEMEKRIRRFLTLDYTYEYDGDDIIIHIDQFDEEAYFILCTYSKSIEYVNHGKAEAMNDTNTTYLIKAEDSTVLIHLTEGNILKKPRNNKIIPSNPE